MIRVRGHHMGAFDDFGAADLAAPWLYVLQNAGGAADDALTSKARELGRAAAEGAAPVIQQRADDTLNRAMTYVQTGAAIIGAFIAISMYLDSRKGRR